MRRAWQRGGALLETALIFPALLLATLGLVQLALWSHAENVAGDAASYGARRAAEVGGDLPSAVASAQSLLQSGLGGYAAGFAVRGQDDGVAVALDVRGSVPLLVPWVGAPALPIHAYRERRKEVVGGE